MFTVTALALGTYLYKMPSVSTELRGFNTHTNHVFDSIDIETTILSPSMYLSRNQHVWATSKCCRQKDVKFSVYFALDQSVYIWMAPIYET